jgi:hypothetical protein
VKNKASFLLSIFLVALSATCCTLLTKDIRAEKHFEFALDKFSQEKISQGLVLTSSGIASGFQDCTRSHESFVSEFNKTERVLDYELVEKFQSIITKVSYRHLVVLHIFQKEDEYLFLDLRKLLI